MGRRQCVGGWSKPSLLTFGTCDIWLCEQVPSGFRRGVGEWLTTTP